MQEGLTKGSEANTTTPVDVQEGITNVSEANTIADPSTMDLVIQKMTDNITKVIDVKIGMVLEAIAGHSAELQEVLKHVDEVEGRIATPMWMDTKIKALEKQVRKMACEHWWLPRPVVRKFHNFTDKQRIMDAARCIGSDDIQRQGPRVLFFNDYSAAVVRRRKAFDEVKAQLKRMKMDYALLYPATLKIMVNGSPKKLYTSEEAAAFIDSLG